MIEISSSSPGRSADPKAGFPPMVRNAQGIALRGARKCNRCAVCEALALILMWAGLWADASAGPALPPGVGVKPLAPASQPATAPPAAASKVPLSGWSFQDIRVTVLGLTAARVEWASFIGNEPATKYRVLRAGVAIAEAPSNVTTFTDNALRDNSSYPYQVQAIGAPRPISSVPNAVPPGANAGATAIFEPVLQTSATVKVTTPPLLAPASVTAEVDTADARAIHVSWPPQPLAQAYNIYRNGILLGHSNAPIVDVTPSPGWYTYAVASVASSQAGEITSPPSKIVTVHTGPVSVVAFGDSIMWGQGLADNHKMTSLVRDWLSASLGAPVQLRSFAHSGAQLTPPPEDDPSTIGIRESRAASALMTLSPAGPIGEVPNTYPTINYQAQILGPSFVDANNVDLIIIDGCINDVRTSSILDPTTKDPDLQAMIQLYCGNVMSTTLQRAHQIYPRAKIIVTGYFLIASSLSDLTFLKTFAAAAGVSAALIAPAILPVVDPVTGAIAAVAGSQIASDSYHKTVVDHSMIFAGDSRLRLSAAVDLLNFNAKQTIARLAIVPLTEPNAYAAPSTWLWLIPSDLYPPKDEAFESRGSICAEQRITTAMSDTAFATCVEASAGHPNVFGAQQFAMAVETQLLPFLSDMKQSLAPRQMSK